MSRTRIARALEALTMSIVLLAGGRAWAQPSCAELDLRSDSAKRRMAALKALAATDDALVPALIWGLRDEDLNQLFRDGDPPSRHFAEALAARPGARAAIAAALASTSHMERAGAAYAACRGGALPRDRCHGVLVAALAGPHEDAAAFAAWGLGRLPDVPDAALAALTAALARGTHRDQSRMSPFRVFRAHGLEVHREAVASLAAHWPRSERTVVRALDDQRPLVAIGAAEVLLRRGDGERRERVLAALRRQLGAAEPAARERAATVLQLIEPPAPQVVEALRGAWRRETDPEVEKALVDALVRHAGAGGVDAYVEALQSDNISLRRAGARAMKESGLARATLQSIKSPSLRVRIGVACGLAAFDQPAAIRIFEEALRSTDPTIRRDALDLVTELRIGAPLVPRIVRLLADAEHVRLGAIRAMASLGEAGVPPLLGALEEPSGTQGEAAASALASIGGASLPGLRAAMTHADVRVRYFAMFALSQIEGARPELERALADAYPVRRLARAALSKLEPRACR